ncbi:MAG: PmoA family protein [Bryobacteraceae bacterium]
MRNAIYPLVAAAALAVPAAVAQVKITAAAETIAIAIGGKPFTTFYMAGKDVTKPYLHPLRAATGTYVTRMWPMEKVAEEASIAKPDHQHQRGLWFAHDSVNGLDFWNNEASYTTPNRGKIVLAKVDGVKSGNKSGSIAATFDWTSLEGHKLLTESRVMTFYAGDKVRVIDFDITLTPVEKVVFGDTKDGTFGIRMRPALQEDKGTGHIANADGLTSEKEVWGKPSNWCDYWGTIEGEKAGIAILDHPDNPHHPVRWHVRAYGLFAANPFGVSVFDPSLPKSPTTVQAGEKLRYRYRVIVHPGDTASADIASRWKLYIAGK